VLSLRLTLLAGIALAAGCSSSSPSTPTPVTASTSAPPNTSTAPTPSPSPTPPTVSSSNANLLNVVPNQGLNYNGTGPDGSGGTGPFTATLYDDPVSGSSENLVLFEESGTEANAFGGNEADSVPLALATLALPATFVQGAVTTIVPGATETVTAVGTVPGSSACPTPVAPGVTVQYVAQSYSANISYVPNCGITNISGEGVNISLTSIGSYPNEGTQIRARDSMSSTIIHTPHGDMPFFFRAHPTSAMPDVYDTVRYGQAMADLLGHHAGANGQLFHPDDAVLRSTRNFGAIAFIERGLAENGDRIGANSYKTYACAFGVSANGDGRLEHARDIGQVWVSGAPGACSTPRSYLALRALADSAIADLTK
jgi:hypothetical protein